jgi:hypothetical protein
MNPLKVIEQRCPDRPLWDPLLKVLPEKTVAQFMFMGEVLCERGGQVPRLLEIGERDAG